MSQKRDKKTKKIIRNLIHFLYMKNAQAPIFFCACVINQSMQGTLLNTVCTSADASYTTKENAHRKKKTSYGSLGVNKNAKGTIFSNKFVLAIPFVKFFFCGSIDKAERKRKRKIFFCVIIYQTKKKITSIIIFFLCSVIFYRDPYNKCWTNLE